MSSKKYVQVAVNLPLNDVFDYSVPENLQDSIEIGKRVWIPFRNRTIVGFIVNISDHTTIPRTRDIKEIIDQVPLLSEEMLLLTRWMADYYFCSWGEAIEAAVAGPFKKGKTSVRLRESTDASSEIKETGVAIEHVLTTHQNSALSQINKCLMDETFGVFLLHGITASGKTEVYFGAIDQALKKNKEAIVFVPEIALTPQTLERFIIRFGKKKVAIIHSRLSKGEKFLEWQRIKQGEVKIVIGARSAIFSPLKNLGLIVVDEEHENTYKQEDIPRYHLVHTAIKRAKISKATVILGSATPSLESTYASRKNDIKFIDLPERIKGRDLPVVQVIDMRGQRKRTKHLQVLSKLLEDYIAKCLKNKEQIILFLNRRGFSTYVHCSKCGYIMQCPHCNIALVYHYDEKRLLCHHCSYHIKSHELCPQCNGNYVRYSGTGTQKVESELHRLFPNAKIGRMDSDALKKKASHFEIFDDFKTRKIDILIGTQMLAKGLDFPNVTLVGVISADVTLNLPDFRASERTFSLLTQVAGRAGRGETAGKVIIQTYTPDHYAIQCAIKHDYNDFYEQEMVFRKQLELPPYAHMISIVLRSKEEEKAMAGAQALAKVINQESKAFKINMLGPSVMPVAKLRGFYRYGIIIKDKDVYRINDLLRKAFKKWKTPSKVKVAVDVDPSMVV
ncbi:MAG: primosomal protein N' [Candidatus Omnitrophica bacterium]|nr:primosomal protein N' [Candidatus Omnitrophota bacterium]